MSTPITCLPNRQDVLFHTLFGSDAVFISRLIEESIIYLSREYPNAKVHDVLTKMRPKSGDTLNKLRAKFFILLNQDTETKKKIGASQGKSCIVSNVCEHKAARFYEDLNSILIPNFAQDQTMPVDMFIENIRDCYLYS
jgi:hypothetical protein